MISRSDILDGQVIDEALELNLGVLLHRLNMFEQFYCKDFKITSGYRSRENQILVYAKRGVTDLKHIPFGSAHMKCCAADIYDPEQKIQEWIVKNESTMREIGFWFEDFSYTKNWVHCQTYPPLSMRRFFKP